MRPLLAATLATLLLLGAASLALAEGDCAGKVKSTKTADTTQTESTKAGG